MSGKITNEEVDYGLLGTEFVAKDEYGHTGYGRTAEEAQYALEVAQEHDLESCVNKVFLVWGKPIERNCGDSDSCERDDSASAGDGGDEAELEATTSECLQYVDLDDGEDDDEKYEDDYNPSEEAEVTEAVDEPVHTLVHVDLIQPSEPEPETGEYVDMYLALHFAENEIAELVSANRNAALEFEHDYQTLRRKLFELKAALDRDGADLIVRWIALRELESLDRLHAYAYLTIRTTTAETSPPIPKIGAQNLIPDRLALIQKHLKLLKGEE